MSTSAPTVPGTSHSAGASANRYLAPMLLLFVGSGCAALIYEIIWYQVIQLVIGSSAISLGVLLGTFMGGMCIGSLLFPRYVKAGIHPLRVYAYLELGIMVCGLLVYFGLPLVGKLYAMIGGQGPVDVFLRAVICAIFLLPPTVMMGATLPAISRYMETTPKGVSWMGFFYGGNIAGAVLGCLLAGFYLLRVSNMLTGTLVAMALNLAVGLLGLAIAARTFYTPPAGATTAGPLLQMGTARPVYLAIMLSGLTALGAEVVWTRVLSLTFGGSVYSFSIILSVFLLGLGLGSSVGSFLARSSANPRLMLGWVQMALTLTLAWAAYQISSALPFWPVNPSLATNVWFTFQMDFVRCMWATMPGAILWGTSFPLAVAAAASKGQDPARLVGGIYAANTVGAIIGAVFFSVLSVPNMGTQGAQRLLIIIAAASGLMLLAPMILRRSGDEPAVGNAAIVPLILAVLAAIMFVMKVPRIPPVLAGYGRYSATYAKPNEVYFGEGMNATIQVTQLDNGVRNFHVAGKIEASTEAQDMRLQRMLGHISALLHPAPKSVLIVGFGAGVTAGSFVTHPGIERIVICEIEPLIPTEIGKRFTEVNYDVANDPRVQIVYDDARHFILTTKEKFDVITSDPIHPWVKGAATLYTKEYFELAKKHLNPGGVITQWVPLYESTTDVVRSEVLTFLDVFPKGTIWSNDINGRGYDVVIAGREGDGTINVDSMEMKLESAPYARVKQSLADVGFHSAVDLLATYGGWGPDLTQWLAGAEINRDSNLRLMYLAGMGLNLYENANIYSEMRNFRRYPSQLFVASPENRARLEAVLGPGDGR
jgi:spermidine synthase